jgi:hypothetical protein
MLLRVTPTVTGINHHCWQIPDVKHQALGDYFGTALGFNTTVTVTMSQPIGSVLALATGQAAHILQATGPGWPGPERSLSVTWIDRRR